MSEQSSSSDGGNGRYRKSRKASAAGSSGNESSPGGAKRRGGKGRNKGAPKRGNKGATGGMDESRNLKPGAGSPRGKGRGGTKPGQQPRPIEIAVRSGRNALNRHAESIKDEQSKLGCRGVLMALHGNLSEVTNPAEILVAIEQVQHVLHAGAREADQLPVAIRAVVTFVLDDVRRTRDVQEMLRLSLRYLYVLSADYMPRQLRDDARFRADALMDLLAELAITYLDNESFERLRS